MTALAKKKKTQERKKEKTIQRVGVVDKETNLKINKIPRKESFPRKNEIKKERRKEESTRKEWNGMTRNDRKKVRKERKEHTHTTQTETASTNELHINNKYGLGCG
jgi:hypothetical protein